MILSRLNDLYYRLADRFDDSGLRPVCLVPPYGFSDEKIGYLLVIDRSGQLIDVQPNFTQVEYGKTLRQEERRLRVPCAFLRTGVFTEKAFNAGKNVSFFLWDKPEFLLGVTLAENKIKLSELPFRAFRAKHEKLIGSSEDVGLSAVLRFIKSWEPKHFLVHPLFQRLMTDTKQKLLKFNFAFKLDGDLGAIADRDAAKIAWLLHWNSQRNGIVRQCLVEGELGPVADTHAPLKVPGGQTSGVFIVSYNEAAYESLGKKQGDNAPVSEQAAFAYTTSLNFLLRRENGQCLSVGDTSTVYWAQARSAIEEQQALDFFSAFADPPTDESQSRKLAFSIENIASGRPFEEVAPDLDPGTRFFVLGLAPNASRLSIRYWLESNLGELGQNLMEHWSDLQIEPAAWSAQHPPSLWRCLIQTAPLGKTENIPPRLAGEWLRSILTGQRYPRQMLTQIIHRLRSDGDVSGLRAALIKAVLHRDFRKGLLKETIPMSLDLENAPVAYRLGCLFAVLERAQGEAIPSANSTIVDRYYGTASSVPYSVFPRLIAGFQNHVSKIRKDKPGFAVSLSKAIGGILDALPPSFPKQLSIVQQGQFAVGYYHQRQSFYSKKLSEPETEATSSI